MSLALPSPSSRPAVRRGARPGPARPPAVPQPPLAAGPAAPPRPPDGAGSRRVPRPAAAGRRRAAAPSGRGDVSAPPPGPGRGGAGPAVPTRPWPCSPAMFNVESLERAELGESLLTWVSARCPPAPSWAAPQGRGSGRLPPRRGSAPAVEAPRHAPRPGWGRRSPGFALFMPCLGAPGMPGQGRAPPERCPCSGGTKGRGPARERPQVRPGWAGELQAVAVVLVPAMLSACQCPAVRTRPSLSDQQGRLSDEKLAFPPVCFSLFLSGVRVSRDRIH